ncbi:NADH dehydrogenase ubiquinone 1 beta subcomplex subunit 6 [Brachionus plicatilis]|uniref:NADH dehydrogenase ubiquinone 1 beta subcomplex subunit 6 n=1 Tax=Brachionus plicatilis TaxID=10195 RepID=A0A3M7RNA7_BRAPC|nr:NADH dehydrogenase ubiquinone 1 beta subcomplex subunit 6 [Brachionus plicatilis]
MTKDKNDANLTESQKKEVMKQNLKVEIKKLLSQETKWTKEPTPFDHFPAHEKPFPIEPFPHERHRLPFKMSEEDRQRRKTWIKSQELTEREPVRVPELEQMIYNPIRRLYRGPTDRLFQALAPVVGQHRVPFFRMIIPKLFLGYIGACVVWYNLKYHKGDWEEKKGFTLIQTRGVYLPEEEKPRTAEKWDFADQGFQARKAFKGPDYAY